MNPSILPSILLGVAIAGCSSTLIKPFARFYEGGQPTIAGVAAHQSRLLFTIIRDDIPTRQSLAVSGLTYASASVSLSNESPAVLTSPIVKSVTFNGSYSASSAFTALRPGNGYRLNISLFDNTNQQIGSGVREKIELPAGQTAVVTVVIGRDGEVNISYSAVGNGFGTSGAYVITKGDDVLFNTGFSGTETAVASWSVFISPELASPSIRTCIASFPASTPFATFSWPTGSNKDTDGWSYDPGSLTTTGNQNGIISFELYDSSNNLVGRSNLTGVSVVEGASMNLQLQ